MGTNCQLYFASRQDGWIADRGPLLRLEGRGDMHDEDLRSCTGSGQYYRERHRTWNHQHRIVGRLPGIQNFFCTNTLGCQPGEASDVAKAVSFLASEDARYITGETMDVNGGFLMD